MSHITNAFAAVLMVTTSTCGTQEHNTVGDSNGHHQVSIFNLAKKESHIVEKVKKTEDEWKKVLTPEAFEVARKRGTERAFTGEYWDNHRNGVYQCVCCGTDLFTSDTKFESGTGWPSFWKPVSPENVKVEVDRSLMMTRSEVLCARCDAHLGHVFDDGPAPTGLRYCMNSAALRFIPGP